MSEPLSPEVRRRIVDTVIAAERDLSAELTVAMMAELAGMSDKHFQRCFLSVVGEPPKKFLRRVRLQHAAYTLVWSDLTVTQIASSFGFLTHAGFTKAFTKAYGLSPNKFRADKNVVPFLATSQKAEDEIDLKKLQANRLMVRIEDLPAQRYALMRHIGPTETVVEVWRKMIPWMDRRGLLKESSTFLGIHHDMWDDFAEDRYRYDAAVSVPDDFEADDEVNTIVIQGGLVAATEFSGSIAEVDQTWRRFVEQWLPVSGFQFRDLMAYDRYPYALINPDFLQSLAMKVKGIDVTLCIPVTR